MYFIIVIIVLYCVIVYKINVGRNISKRQTCAFLVLEIKCSLSIT